MNSLTNLLAFFSALFFPCAVQSSVVQPFRLLVFIHVQFFFFHCSLPLARCYFVNASSFSFDVIRLLYNYFFLLLLLLFGCCVRLCLVVVFFSMLHSSDNILCCYTAIRFMLWNFWCVTHNFHVIYNFGSNLYTYNEYKSYVARFGVPFSLCLFLFGIIAMLGCENLPVSILTGDTIRFVYGDDMWIWVVADDTDGNCSILCGGCEKKIKKLCRRRQIKSTAWNFFDKSCCA